MGCRTSRMRTLCLMLWLGGFGAAIAAFLIGEAVSDKVWADRCRVAQGFAAALSCIGMGGATVY